MRVEPQAPPLDLPLPSLIEVANVDSTVKWGFFDEFCKFMLVSQYFITQRRRKFDLCFPKSDNKCLLTCCQNSKSIAKCGVYQLNSLSILTLQ